MDGTMYQQYLNEIKSSMSEDIESSKSDNPFHYPGFGLSYTPSWPCTGNELLLPFGSLLPFQRFRSDHVCELCCPDNKPSCSYDRTRSQSENQSRPVNESSSPDGKPGCSYDRTRSQSENQSSPVNESSSPDNKPGCSYDRTKSKSEKQSRLINGSINPDNLRTRSPLSLGVTCHDYRREWMVGSPSESNKSTSSDGSYKGPVVRWSDVELKCSVPQVENHGGTYHDYRREWMLGLHPRSPHGGTYHDYRREWMLGLHPRSPSESNKSTSSDGSYKGPVVRWSDVELKRNIPFIEDVVNRVQAIHISDSASNEMETSDSEPEGSESSDHDEDSDSVDSESINSDEDSDSEDSESVSSDEDSDDSESVSPDEDSDDSESVSPDEDSDDSESVSPDEDSEDSESASDSSESLHSESFACSSNESFASSSNSPLSFYSESSSIHPESIHSESLSSHHHQESIHSKSSSSHPESIHSDSYKSSNRNFETINEVPREPVERQPVSSESSSSESEEEADPQILDAKYTAGPFSDNYTHLERLRNGTFGCVAKGFRNSDGLLVVTKFIRKSSVYNDELMFDQKMQKMVPIEVSLLRLLNHANIIKVHDVFENADYYHLVMETHGSSMDLFEFIDRNTCREDPLICYIFRQIVDAVSYLHSHCIVHRDIKDDNCLIDSNFHVKLIDFGSAAIMSEEPFTKFCGTKMYCSPEVLRGEPYHGPELEMFALGVTLYSLAFGDIPFVNKEEILECDCKFPDGASEGLVNLITGMLEPIPEHRLILPEVEINRWMNQEVDIEAYSFAVVVNATDEELRPLKYVPVVGPNKLLWEDRVSSCLQPITNKLEQFSRDFILGRPWQTG